jgi:hypothetical protein
VQRKRADRNSRTGPWSVCCMASASPRSDRAPLNSRRPRQGPPQILCPPCAHLRAFRTRKMISKQVKPQVRRSGAAGTRTQDPDYEPTVWGFV